MLSETFLSLRPPQAGRGRIAALRDGSLAPFGTALDTVTPALLRRLSGIDVAVADPPGRRLRLRNGPHASESFPPRWMPARRMEMRRKRWVRAFPVIQALRRTLDKARGGHSTSSEALAATSRWSIPAAV